MKIYFNLNLIKKEITKIQPTKRDDEDEIIILYDDETENDIAREGVHLNQQNSIIEVKQVPSLLDSPQTHSNKVRCLIIVNINKYDMINKIILET